MKVTINGRDIYVRWKYDDVSVIRGGRMVGKTKETTCIATLNGETLHQASVKRYHLDLESKEEARYQSLKKLVEELYPSKSVSLNGEPSPSQIAEIKRKLKAENLPNKQARHIFWKAYRERKKNNLVYAN